MEIKKADSKGRVSGLEKGRYYRVDRLGTGSLIFTPLGLKEDYHYYEGMGTAEEAEMLLNQAMAKKNGAQ